MSAGARDHRTPATPSHYVPVQAVGDENAADVHALLRREWWSADRTLDDVRRLLAGTPVRVGLRDTATGGIVGFARALGDGVLKALVLDLVVAPAHRGRGLGRRLLEAVLAHPLVAGARHVELYCAPGMLGFYGRFGFAAPDDVRLLRRTRPRAATTAPRGALMPARSGRRRGARPGTASR